MSDNKLDQFLIGLFNTNIREALPRINSGIEKDIKSANLDPWGQVAHGVNNFGSINLVLCNASANASYNIINMSGLSSIRINSIEVNSIKSVPTYDSRLLLTFDIMASMNDPLTAQLGGGIEARCTFAHPYVGIGGTAIASGIAAVASGSLTVELGDTDSQFDVHLVSLSPVTVNFNEVFVEVNGLGIFSICLDALINAFTVLFKNQVKGAISSALTPIIRDQISNVLAKDLI